jgi:hypothetical protein
VSWDEQVAGHAAGVHGILDGGRPPEPGEADFQQETAAAGEEALLPLGIVYHAHWQDPTDGMARHARSAVRALSTVLPVTLRAMGSEKAFVDEELDADIFAKVSPALANEHGLSVNTERTVDPISILHVEDRTTAVIIPAGETIAVIGDSAVEQKFVAIEWNGKAWAGIDVPDYAPTLKPEAGVGPFIMLAEGMARLFARFPEAVAGSPDILPTECSRHVHR